MKRLAFPEPEIKIAMSSGFVDVLTVIPRDKIVGPGKCYVRRAIMQSCAGAGQAYSPRKWKQYWAYFRATWLRKYDPNVWNIHGVSKTLVSRTNNPLERFSRKINTAVGAPHPILSSFIRVIDELSREHVKQLDEIAASRASKRRRRTPERFMLPPVPELPDGDGYDDTGAEESEANEGSGSESDLSGGAGDSNAASGVEDESGESVGVRLDYVI